MGEAEDPGEQLWHTPTPPRGPHPDKAFEALGCLG